MIRPILAAALLAAPLAAAAQQDAEPEPLALDYATFESAVPHLDLDTCPSAIEAQGAFCRVTMANDEIHVFAFAEGGDQPLVEVAHLPADALSAALD